MSSTERHLARIEYENALRGLKSKKNLEMDEAVNSLDVFFVNSAPFFAFEQ